MTAGSAASGEVPTILTATNDSPSESVATYVLRVVEGPDRGTALTLDDARPARLFIGQSQACDLKLADPRVSRRHAVVEATHRGIRVTDLGSTNGTWVQRTAIVDAYVAAGETIRMGSTALEVGIVAPPHAIAQSSAVRFGRVFGSSREMRRLYPLCERLAAADVPVVIEGETGTGKEFLAEALHEEGPRASGPFMVFDCTAVPPTLVESMLFGHERGAFTGAVAQRKGVFELAHGGTLLIDEIGDLDPMLQPKLLRALERSEVQRVGGDKWIKVDVRILAATRRDLDVEVQAGRFREDLYYRLAIARIELPPLRERHGDIGLLTRHFWRKLDPSGQQVPNDIVARFESYGWPGNVRELRNAVARRVALGDLAPPPGMVDRGGATSPARSSSAPSPADDLVSRILAKDLPLPLARQDLVDEFERRYVERVLAKYDGNVTRAAHASGIARRYFYTLRSRLGV